MDRRCPGKKAPALDSWRTVTYGEAKGDHHAQEVLGCDANGRDYPGSRQHDQHVTHFTGIGSGPDLKTPWGEPDLQGIWTDETDTPLQRPAQYANQEFFT